MVMYNLIFKIYKAIKIFLICTCLYIITLTNAYSNTYIAENISTECKFVFSNFFKNFVKIKDNNAIFSIDKTNSSVQFATTNELEASIQITKKLIIQNHQL